MKFTIQQIVVDTSNGMLDFALTRWRATTCSDIPSPPFLSGKLFTFPRRLISIRLCGHGIAMHLHVIRPVRPHYTAPKRPTRVERALSWKQLLNAADRAEVHVTHAHVTLNVPPEAQKELLMALKELRRVLARAGRRPEHLRYR